MVNDSPDHSSDLLFLSGLYSRVARQLGVHPSYVSRVARGERRSDRVYRAIATELSKLRGAATIPPDTDIKESRNSALKEVRQRLTKLFQADNRLRRLNAVIIDAEAVSPSRRQSVPRRVPAASLSARLASNARLMAVTVGAFERLSRKLERFPHVLSLLDSDGIVLYSTGTTGMARREHRIPGVDWSKDYRGISSAARAIAAGVPITVIGALELHGTLTPSVRLACPVRLSDGSIAGVLNLTIEITRARPDHMLEICKMARTVCKFVENGPMGAVRTRDQKSRVQPFVDAARNVATVLSLPQIDPATRMALSGLLADLENTGRELILKPTVRKRRTNASVRALGAG